MSNKPRDPFDHIATAIDDSERGEIVITAVVDRIPYGPNGVGSALEAAFKSASGYVGEQARIPGSPWDAEAIFSLDGSEFRVSGHGI